MATTVELLHELASNCEAEAERQLQLNTCIMSMRRRIQAALGMLAQDRPEDTRQMLEMALADNGEFIKRRIDKVMKQWIEGHP